MKHLLWSLILLAGCQAAKAPPERSVVPDATRIPVQNSEPPARARMPDPPDRKLPAPSIQAVVPQWVDAVCSGGQALTPSLYAQFYRLAVNERLLRHDWDWLEKHAADLRNPAKLKGPAPPLRSFYQAFQQELDRDLYPTEIDIQWKALEAWCLDRPDSVAARVAMVNCALGRYWPKGRDEGKEVEQAHRVLLDLKRGDSGDPEFYCGLAEAALYLEGPTDEFRIALERAYALSPEYIRAQTLDCIAHSDWYQGSTDVDWEKGLKSEIAYDFVCETVDRDPLRKSDRHKPNSRGIRADWRRAFASRKQAYELQPDRIDWAHRAIGLGGGEEAEWGQSVLNSLGPQVDQLPAFPFETRRKMYLAGAKAVPTRWAKLPDLTSLALVELNLERNLLQAQVSELASLHRIEELEAVATRLRQQKLRFRDGELKLATFYRGLVAENTSSDAAYRRTEMFKQWSSQHPKSHHLALGMAAFWIDKKWYLVEQGPPEMQETLGQAQLCLAPVAGRSPEALAMQMDIAIGLAEPIEPLMKPLLKLSPNYMPLYGKLAQYYSPNRLAGPDLFEKRARMATKDPLGPAAYALMAYDVARRRELQLVPMDWPLIEKGFQQLEKRTGDTTYRTKSALCAAALGQNQQAAALVSKLDTKAVDPKILGGYHNLQDLQRQSMTVPF